MALEGARTRDAFDMQAPWSGYPGYTSVQVEDFNRAGENAWLLRAAYNFASVPGLSAYGLYVDGSQPASANEFEKREWALNLQWAAQHPALEGLLLRVRYARVDEQRDGSSHLDDLRLIVYYDPPGW